MGNSIGTQNNNIFISNRYLFNKYSLRFKALQPFYKKNALVKAPKGIFAT